MKKLATLLACVVFGWAGGAAAEACNSEDGLRVAMTAIGTAGIWGGCTPDATDDFTVDGTANVIIAGGTLAAPITMNSLTLNGAGATLTIAPGSVVQLTGDATIVAGTFNMEGTVLYRGEVSLVSYLAYASGIEVTVKGLPVGVTAGQYLVVLDEDPTNSGTVGGSVTTMATARAAGTYRPSYNKWTWYRITAVTADKLTVSWDEFDHELVGEYGAGTDVDAYTGQRSVPILTAAPHTPATAWTREQYGFSSRLDIAEAACTGGSVTGDCAVSDADLGSMYVEWVSGTCDGMSAKIIHAQTDISTNTDRIWVAGDATACGTGNIVITNGLRIGDKVAVVSPAQINGNNTGSILFDFAAATVRAEWFRFIQLDDYAMVGVGGNGYCNVCLYNSSGNTTNTASASSFRNGEVAFVSTFTNDTSAVGAMNVANGSATPLGGELWDASGLVFDRMYIHDQIGQPAAATYGNHGIFHRSPRGFKATRARISRMGDDLYGHDNDRKGGSVDSYALAQDIVAVELLPPTANTDECLSIDDAHIAAFLPNSGTRVTGFMALGCGTHSLTGSSIGNTYRDMVAGGTGNANAGDEAGRVPLGPGLALAGGYPATFIDDNAGLIDNSIIWLAGHAANTNNYVDFPGAIDNSILSSITDPEAGLLNATRLRRTFTDLGGGFYVMQSNTSYLSPQSISWVDSAIVSWSNGSTNNLIASQLFTGGLLNLDMQRVYLAVYSPSGSGLLEGGLQDASQSVDVDGFTLSATNPSAVAFYTRASTGSGATISNACVDVTGAAVATSSSVFGESATASSLVMPGVGVNATEDVPIRAFVNMAGARTGCAANFPKALGLERISVTHSLLGDLFLTQTASYSSRDFFGTSGAGGGSLPQAY